MAFLKCMQAFCAHYKSALQTFGAELSCGRLVARHFGQTAALSCNSPQIQSADSVEVNKRLMEFFDDKKNWGEEEVKVGRCWRKDELRIKSNADLHKLWFVLLKEKNMLLSMEHESNERMMLFPNPERLDKVEESMTNLEEVVRERNKAYHMLETGEDGERPGRVVINPLGIRYFYRMREHAVPHQRNLKWWRKLKLGYENSPSVNSFLRLYREQLYLAKKRKRTLNFNHVQHLLHRFPHVDLETIRKNYPEVDIEKACSSRRADGSHELIS